MPTMVSAPPADAPAGMSDMVTVWRPRRSGSSLLCRGDPRMLTQERGHDVAPPYRPERAVVAPPAVAVVLARRRRDGHAVQLGGVAGEDAFLHRRRERGVPEALLVGGRDLERPEHRDLVLR